ncbi:MAG: exosortase U [Planctomycetaceae bacterium]|nr:exosortase U [Planctomycetaceae bacterium]
MDFLKQRPWVIPFLALLFGFVPILVSFFRQQFAQPEYQAFPIMLGAAAIFLYSRLNESRPIKRANRLVNGIAWLLTAIAAGLLITSFVVFSPWLAMVAFVLYCLAIAGSLWQHWQIRGLFGIWLLLALLVPPPLDRDKMLIERLQLFSSKVTSVMLDAIGVLHVSQGNSITLSDRELFVDEACSGIVSLISILYCIAIYCLWQRRSLIHMGLLAIIGVAWTVLMNSLRLIIISLSWSWYQLDLIKGWPHTLLGLVIFGISAAVIFSVDRFLQALLAPIRQSATESEVKTRWTVGRALVYGWNQFIATPPETDPAEALDDADSSEQTAGDTQASLTKFLAPQSVFGYPATFSFAALGLVYLGFFLPQEVSQTSNIQRALRIALDLNESTPIAPEGWELVRFSNDRRSDLFRWDNWGEYSRTYELRDPDGFIYQLSCDFMFGPHWHDLRSCYRGTGWQIYDERVLDFVKLSQGLQEPVDVESSLTSPPVVEQFSIRRVPDVRDGLITYGAFRANGAWFNRPRGRGLWQDFVAHVVQGRDRAEQADYFQIQVTTFFEDEINPRQKERSEWLLHHGTDWLRNHLTKPSGS